MPQVSIIVPVYNAEKYIHECLNSIISQTFKDWECILVDDGASDGSGAICDDYVRNDSRFHIYHQENGGASSARNYGIEKANGNWVCFIDSDDSVLPDYVEHLLNNAAEGVDIVYSNYSDFDYIKNDCCLKGKEIVSYMVANNIFAMSGPYAKLFRSNLLKENGILFPTGIHMGEDAIFNVRALNFANTVVFITSNDYIYNRNEGSLSTRYYPFESEYHAFEIWKSEELSLFKKYYHPRIALRLTWETRVAAQMTRVLQSTYRHTPSCNIIQQIRYLNIIKESDLYEYNLYYKPNKFRRKVNKWLVCNHLFGLFCIIGIIDKYK